MGLWRHHVPHDLQSPTLHILGEAIDVQDDQVRPAELHAQPFHDCEQGMHRSRQADASQGSQAAHYHTGSSKASILLHLRPV